MLKRLRRESGDSVFLTWVDGHEGPVSLKSLRDQCPCAGCSGETVLFQSYVPPEADRTRPGRYELKGAEPVGNYALKLLWGDGHGEGLYTWEHLRSLCECSECLRKKGGS
jgi:DUF971 family protein